MVSVIRARNAAEALPQAIDLLLREGKRETSRNGEVLVMPWPVVTVLSRPWEKVIMSPVRDANPFFHLCEAAWMIAGRNDVASLTPYVKNFVNYAEPDGTVYGAYGNRWRHHFGYDQLEAIFDRLQNDPSTRQAVISMWDATEQELAGGDDLRVDVKDRPCNTSVMLRLTGGVLNMSVTNRSHDVLWGLLGANCVHFAVLLENLAARLDVGVGSLTFFSHNFHIYLDVLEKMLLGFDDVGIGELALTSTPGYGDGPADLRTLPLYTSADQASSDGELNLLWEQLDKLHSDQLPDLYLYDAPFYNDVFWAASAHKAYRGKDWGSATINAQRIKSPDWRMACVAWLARRQIRQGQGGTGGAA